MSLLDHIEGARWIVVAGPGGVGKTTTAACIAVACARAGRRTLALTVDPARRLADALGVTPSTSHDVAVEGLPLTVAMLESEATFRALLPRMIESAEARQHIEANRVYQRFLGSLARTHAYASLERLHDVLFGEGAGTFDVVVLDTPPMRGLLDLFDAPRALAALAGSRAVDVLSGRGGISGRLARASLGMLTGPELAEELARFLDAFAPFRAGFAARASAVASAQRAPDVRTVLVTNGEPMRIADARALGAALEARTIPRHLLIGSAVIGRNTPAWPIPPSTDASARPILEAAHRLGERARMRQEQATRALRDLAASMELPCVVTARSETDPIGVAMLDALAATARAL